jgi:hypothetical protein
MSPERLKRVERMLEVVKRLQTLTDAEAKGFLFFYLGILCSSGLTDETLNDLEGCAKLFRSKEISSAPAEGESSKNPNDAGASE